MITLTVKFPTREFCDWLIKYDYKATPLREFVLDKSECTFLPVVMHVHNCPYCLFQGIIGKDYATYEPEPNCIKRLPNGLFAF